MEERIKNILTRVSLLSPAWTTEQRMEIVREAKAILEDEFKNEVISKFVAIINPTNHWNDAELIKAVTEKDRFDFVRNSYYYARDFINENWSRLDDIMGILDEYRAEIIAEQEKEEDVVAEH